MAKSYPTIPAILALLTLVIPCGASPYLSAGAKTGEVTTKSAIIWTRLTKHPDANWEGAEFPKTAHSTDAQLPDGASIGDMLGALPGFEGEARVTFWQSEHPTETRLTEWQTAKADTDFTTQFALSDLRPGTRYEFMLEARADEDSHPSAVIDGVFSTAPIADADASVSFVAATGFDWNSRDDAGDQGHLIYESMVNLAPDFFIHAGGIVDYDAPGPIARDIGLARHKWNRMWVLKNSRDFYRNVPCYIMSRQPSLTSAPLDIKTLLKVFREQVPVSKQGYRTFRWGKHLQVWLLENVAHTGSDADPQRVWGDEQLAWAEKTITESDATFKVFLTPSPLVAAQMKGEGLPEERKRAQTFLADQKNLFIISGDRHWQYQTQDPQTGLIEYGIGSGTESTSPDARASAPTAPQFSRQQGGFLQVNVDPQEAPLQIVFTYYDVDGNEVHTASHVAVE